MDDHNSIPSLSILVNNYNYGRYLREALDSVLPQMRAGDELIVVDDGSTDDSREILREYELRDGITVVIQDNAGQLPTVCTGILRASGDVLALLDSDDYYLPGYLDRLRALYRDHPQVECVFAAPQLNGEPDAVGRIRDELEQAALPAGVVGSTRWAATLFAEFVGVPTSGNSLRRELAQHMARYCAGLDTAYSATPRPTRWPGFAMGAPALSKLTADGVLVRAASIMGAIKYCDDRPGFCYRIHRASQYSSKSKLWRWYTRRHRKRFLVQALPHYLDRAAVPTACELRAEILARSYGLRRFRCLHVRALYLKAAIRARGSLGERLAVLAAAAGISRG